MRITWVNPAFGYYRVPVYGELDAICGGQLSVVFSVSRTGEGRRKALEAVLGDRAIGMRGERASRVGRQADFANHGVRVPYQRGLLRAVLAAEAECLIAEGFFQWTPAALVASLRQRIPLVIAYERTAHTERHAGSLRRLYRRLVVRSVDAIACNGSLSRDYCVRTLGFPEGRTVTGAMAGDTALMTSADVAPAPAVFRRLPHPRFLCVGRLVVPKGVATLLEAWSQAAQSRDELGSLVVIGDGPERENLASLVHRLNLQNVVFEGAVSYQHMPAYYAACDALVMPTLEDNWSLVVPEAMAAGKPILCSVYNGCWPELVHERVNGWVFDPLDPVSGVNALLAASEAGNRLREMGQASKRIVADYTPRRAAEAVYKACEIAVNHRRGRAR